MVLVMLILYTLFFLFDNPGDFGGNAHRGTR